MVNKKYSTHRDEIIKFFSSGFNIWENEMLIGKFNLVRAGLLNYLPKIASSEHTKIFMEILMHQQLSILEQSQQEVMDFVHCENLCAEKLRMLHKGGNIICTFHTGSYRIINQLLVKKQIPFTLVTARSIMEKEGAVYEELFNRFSEGPSSFGLIDAESPNSMIQMLREIKKGKNLVLYIDGNTGLGNENDENKNLCHIPFLGQEIAARKGIAFLSYIAKVPILTVASFRKSNEDIRLRFFEPILPEMNMDREEYSLHTTNKIYSLVSPIISEFPGQWEAWLYLHKVANIINPIHKPNINKNTNPNAIKEVTLNLERFGIFKERESCYLFELGNYNSYSIDKSLYQLLLGSIESPIEKNKLDEPMFEELYLHEALVPALD